MAKKKGFNPPILSNSLGSLYGSLTTASTEETQNVVKDKAKVGRPVSKPQRKQKMLNISLQNIQLLTRGRLEEKFLSDSDFLDHILDEYFKGKWYNE